MIKTLPSYSPEHILRSLAPKGLFPLEYLLRIYMLYCVHLCVCMLAKSLQSCMTLCNPMDCSPPVSLVHRVLQARILEWLPFLLIGGLPDPEIKPASPALADGFFTTEPPGKPVLYSYIHVHGESHGQGSLAGYSSWDHKELDMT